jgi:DNA-binding NarL/FixJ family response regulator
MNIKEAFGKDVLVIENPDLVKSYMRVPLEQMGFKTVSFANNTSEAETILAKRDFDMILCSYSLKTRLDGYYFYINLKSNSYLPTKTAFMFMGAESSADVIQSIIDYPADGFIVKPFTILGLQKNIQKCLQRKAVFARASEHFKANQFAQAMTEISEIIKFPRSKDHVSSALKMRGDVLLSQKEFKEANRFFKEISEKYNFSWATNGLMRTEIVLGNEEYAEKQLIELASNPHTKICAYELLTALHIKQASFEEALESAQIAAELSPNNLERQEVARLIAVLAKDYKVEEKIARRILRNVIDTVAEDPQHFFNAISASINVSITEDALEANEAIALARRNLSELNRRFPNRDLRQEINILEARLQCVQNNEERAYEILKNNIESAEFLGTEAKVEKAKMLHELGMHGASMELFDQIEAELAGQINQIDDILSPLRLYMKTVEVEHKTREAMLKNPRELNKQALYAYEEGNFDKAYELFRQAQLMVPKSASIALNLMQVLVKLQISKWMEDFSSVIYHCIDIIEQQRITDAQAIKYSKLKQALAV